MAENDAVDERAVHLREEGRLLVERCREFVTDEWSTRHAADMIRDAVELVIGNLPPRPNHAEPLGTPRQETVDAAV